ncbi:MAG: YraN family protein [Alphaproteobacteria bacterium]|nr:YraN family protein [Alphaproteobacteria bacterium]
MSGKDSTREKRTQKRKAQRSGRWAESRAAWFLRLKGYRILERNWRHPVGEVDLIARRGGTLVFIEVKARPSEDQAREALQPRQQQRILRAAEAWLARNPSCANMHIRFDLITIVPGQRPQHSKAAWSAPS